MNSLLARLLRKPAPRKTIRVVVHRRADCSCCDKALATLEPFRQRFRMEIETVDIDRDADPELRRKYDLIVPVVTINGRERFRGSINPVLLERVLRTESRGD